MAKNNRLYWISGACILGLAACGDDGLVPDSDDPASAAGAPATSPGFVVPRPPPAPAPSSSTPPTSTASATLAIENHFTNLTIAGLYVSPSNQSIWGPNQLRGRSIAPGQNYELVGIPCAASYDLKFTGTRGETLTTLPGLFLACGRTTRLQLTR